MKPFPWKCGTCRQKAVWKKTVPYSTEVEHDGRIYPVRIDRLEVLRCDSCGALVLDDDADAKVTEAFRAQAGLLTPQQVRENRRALGLTQEALADRLQVASATVSRWENGGQVQQRAMDLLMRVFFEVPEARDFMEGVAGVAPPRTGEGSGPAPR